MLSFFINQKNYITVSTKEKIDQIKYGVVKFKKKRVLSINEKPLNKYHINAGIYVVNKNIFKFIKPNQKIDMPERLKWMVFKVKQRAVANYFKKTVLRNPEVNTLVSNSNVTKDEFGDTNPIQYNWPYDFFSLVELVKIDTEVELGNADFSEYTDNLPSWDPVEADQDKIEFIVGGLEDNPIADTQVPDRTVQEGIEVSTQVFAKGSGPQIAGTQLAAGVTPSGLGFNPVLQARQRDIESARIWLQEMGRLAQSYLSITTFETDTSKSRARRQATFNLLYDERLNEFMSRIGMVSAAGITTFDKEFPWEMKLASDYGGLSIPASISQLLD